MKSSYLGVCSAEIAQELALSQLGTSACGATAVLSAAILCDLIRKEEIASVDMSLCILRRRAETAPLPQYLLSRYNAGCTGEEVATSFNAFARSRFGEEVPISSNRESIPAAKFISFSEMPCPIEDFVEDHLLKGCILIATLNLQIIGNDAWHHQLIYGMNRENKSVYMMNPMEECSLTFLERFISTPSVLLIRREDVVSRCDRDGADFSIFSRPEWLKFNVMEQVENIKLNPDVDYLVIPAAYVGGFTVIHRTIT